MYKSFKIGQSVNYLEVQAQNYAYPSGDNYWDRNWINVVVKVKAGGFTGGYSAYFQTTDFVRLNDIFQEAYLNSNCHLEFSTLEEQLSVQIKGDGLGHIVLDCKAVDQAGIGNTLSFEIEIDQSFIPSIIEQLNDVIKTFPVLHE